MTENTQNPLEIGVFSNRDLASSSEIALNDSGTCEKSGTRLTQNRSPGVLGFTYFVRVDDAIKIGSATSPKDRISAIQTAHVKPLDVLAVLPAALVDEYKAHQLFAHLRIRGEWFRADRDLLDFIEQAKIDAQSEPPATDKPTPPQPKAISAPLPHDAMRRRLIALRVSVGAESRRGHAASNLAEQLKHYQTATGAQRESLARSIPYQMARLSGQQ